MWSAWEDAVAENHLEVDLGRAAYERIDVPAVGLQAGSIGERPSNDVAHGQGASR